MLYIVSYLLSIDISYNNQLITISAYETTSIVEAVHNIFNIAL